MAVEILAEAGLVAPEHAEMVPVAGRLEHSQIPIDEAKLVRVVRIEPEEEDRIKRLLARAKSESSISKGRPAKNEFGRSPGATSRS